jgi:hypothetical protein
VKPARFEAFYILHLLPDINYAFYSHQKADNPGIVSAAALDAGGYVHGIIPRSLIERAAESTLAAAGHPATGSGSGSEGVKSGEGQGSDLLDHDFEGRFTTEVTSGMHEVCLLREKSYRA